VTLPIEHGTVNGYSNRGCRCAPCKAAKAAYHQRRKQEGRVHALSSLPSCVVCFRRIVGIPEGWKHVADNRQFGEDGHEAEPWVIA
jgi:hypothetical protein